MCSNARRWLDGAEKKKYNELAFEAHGREEFLLLPHDDDACPSMRAHLGPSPLDVDVECMLGFRAPQLDIDDHSCGHSMSQEKDGTTPGYVNRGMDMDDTPSAEMEDYSAFALAYPGLAYGSQLPNDSFRESMAQTSRCLSTAPMTPHQPAQRHLFSTVPIASREAQRDSGIQSHARNAPARVLHHANHEESQSEETRTTVMLRNLPLRYTSSKLMHTIDSEGFASMYDFIYVPLAAGRSSKGYAFVNWVNPFIAQRFLSAFNGFSRWSTASRNVCHAVWAEQQQGLQTNIDRYRNSTVLGKTVPDECKPRIFKNGVEMSFPPPNRKRPMHTRRVGQPRKNNAQQTLWL